MEPLDPAAMGLSIDTGGFSLGPSLASHSRDGHGGGGGGMGGGGMGADQFAAKQGALSYAQARHLSQNELLVSIRCTHFVRGC